jgi:hypothetical protein
VRDASRETNTHLMRTKMRGTSSKQVYEQVLVRSLEGWSDGDDPWVNLVAMKR